MANNVTLPATGSGTATPVVASEDIGGVQYQRVKLVDGTAAGTGLIGGDATNGLDVDVTRLPALVAGTALIGDVAIQGRTTGGLTPYHLVSAASTNLQVPRAQAATLYGWYIYNNRTSMAKVAFHNSATTPTAGAGIYFTVNVPGSSASNVSFAQGIAFSNGIAISTVTGVTDASTTAVAVSDLTINLFYK